MKRFVIKFYALFAIILGVVGYYAWFVKPQISGDIGRIGQIPFGKEYDERMELPYRDRELKIHAIAEGEEIPDLVITIGDSFSQLTECDYNYRLADELGCYISNITRTPASPEQTFVRLVNQGKIPKGAIVIVESVERALISRLANLDLEDAEIQKHGQVQSGGSVVSALDGAGAWLRISLGMKKPYKRYRADRELFTHETRHKVLYIYDSKWDEDGDLRFVDNLNESDIEKAWENLYRLHEFAEKNGVKMLYMIAADKYDVYEPFITDEHVKNPTLDACPEEPWIFNTKPFLQQLVSDGEKDVYRINNTHWSPKGAEIIAGEVEKRLILVTK